MKKLLFLACLLVLGKGYSQEQIPLVDIDVLTEEAAISIRNGEYTKTLEILNRVNKNDSTYCSVLVSKSYYLLTMDRYEEALEVVEEGLNRDCEDSNYSYFINKGVALESLGKDEEALQVYNEALVRFPKNATLWYNKGVILEKQEKPEEAINAFQTAVYYKPSYRNPHLKLGNIAYKQEKLAQAMMCFNTYLLLEPDADDASSILGAFNNLVISKNPNSANPAFSLSVDEDSFEMIDLILENRLALNENYETGNKIQIPLIKQNHALLDQLKNYDETDGFWAQTYVPLYRWIVENNRFNDFAHTLSYSIQNEQYVKIIEKNINGIKSFAEDFNTKWLEILSSSQFRPNAEEKGLHYNYINNYLEAVGKMEGSNTVGKWQLYNADGAYGGEGTFNSKGEREGEWIWYFNNGVVKETGHYKNGLLQGENIMFFPNGKPRYVAQFVDDELDGEYKFYNEKGALLQKKFFKAGKLEGLYQAYFAVGEDLPEFYVPYKEDRIEEKFIEYYANGDVYSEIAYKNGEKNGPEKFYNFNKTLYSETNYVAGVPTGDFKTYYSNGNLKEAGKYENGEFHGTYKTFYEDGKLQSEFTYSKGEINGPYKYYDRDAKLHYTYEYKKGKITAYTFYKKDGSVVDKGSKKGGEFFYKGYSPVAKLTSEGLYDISGGKTGRWKFYSQYGVLESEGDYQEDMAIGEYRTYFANGNIKTISNYRNGLLQGYFVEYHPNGKMKSQGWFKDDLRNGEWRDYFIDGNLFSINFYHKGQFHGNQEYYSGSGDLVTVTTCKFGELIQDNFYSENNNFFESIDYKVAESSYVLTSKHFNGKVQSNTSYVNGVKHGLYEYYDFDGNKRISGNYLNGTEHGAWTWWYANGNVERESIYQEGKLHGAIKDYHENGQLENDYSYDYGRPSGNWMTYYEDGTKHTTTQFQEGEFNGRKEFFGPSGKMQLIRFYKHGKLTGYSYHDKNGEEIPMVELPNETGLITAYFDNGRVSRQMEYLNGEITNTYKAYYYTGVLENEIQYDNGLYNGLYVEYYENGNKKMEKNYLYDHLHGVSKTFYENGNPKEEITYANNLKEGEARYYNAEGKLFKKEKLIHDEVVSNEVL